MSKMKKNLPRNYYEGMNLKEMERYINYIFFSWTSIYELTKLINHECGLDSGVAFISTFRNPVEHSRHDSTRHDHFEQDPV